MIQSIRTAAVPAILAALFVGATWLPTLGAPQNPFAEQAVTA